MIFCKECEEALISCVENENADTALAQTQAFKNCMDVDVFSGLSGCHVDCAPTFAMLAASQNPTTAEFEIFGAGTGEASEKPATSICEIDQEVNSNDLIKTHNTLPDSRQ